MKWCLFVEGKSKFQRGAAIVEFAMASALFFSIIFGALFAAFFCFQWVGLQYSAYKTVRWASLGTRLDGSIGPISAADIKDKFQIESRAIGLKIDRQNIKVCSSAAAGNCDNLVNLAASSSFSVSILQPFILPGFPGRTMVTIPVIAWGRSEPFPGIG